MCDTAIITRAVSAAEGWDIIKGDVCSPDHQFESVADPSREMLDALAAQLARQFMQANKTYIVPYALNPMTVIRGLLSKKEIQ